MKGRRRDGVRGEEESVRRDTVISKLEEGLKTICSNSFGRHFWLVKNHVKAVGRHCKMVGGYLKSGGRYFKTVGGYFKTVGKYFKLFGRQLK